MAYINDKHEEGCRPMKPCRICNAVAFLDRKLSPGDLLQLDEILNGPPQEGDEKLNRPVAELELSIRAANALFNDKIMTVGQLIKLTESEILRIPAVGRRSLNEIKEVLAGLGLRLGMKN